MSWPRSFRGQSTPPMAARRQQDVPLHQDRDLEALDNLTPARSPARATNEQCEAMKHCALATLLRLPLGAAAARRRSRWGCRRLACGTFVADNYAPFYSLPIECTDRD